MTGPLQVLRHPMAAAFLALVLVLPGATWAQNGSAPAAPPAPAVSGAPMAPAAPPVATPPSAPDASAVHSDIALQLPRDLSPWGMFQSADIVVKVVMIGLALASLLTWTIWFAKTIELMIARQRLRRALRALVDVNSLAAAVSRLQGMSPDAQALARAADKELRISADAMVADGVKERVASRLERVEAAAGRHMIRGTGWLASVGATAPFVGLFGTVWGIMNSFIGISRQHTTNLAVVAPGIAEALLATALGLVAAIPAVVMYNMISRWSTTYRALLADCAAEVLRLVSRDLDRGALDPGAAAHRRPAAAE